MLCKINLFPAESLLASKIKTSEKLLERVCKGWAYTSRYGSMGRPIDLFLLVYQLTKISRAPRASRDHQIKINKRLTSAPHSYVPFSITSMVPSAAAFSCFACDALGRPTSARLRLHFPTRLWHPEASVDPPSCRHCQDGPSSYPSIGCQAIFISGVA